MIRKVLESSGLFVEGTEVLTRSKVANCYYGFNVTKTDREPVDQIHAFFAAKRIQERNLNLFGEEGEFTAFIAGVFEVLNATNLTELQGILQTNIAKDSYKKALFQRIMNAYNIRGNVYLTQDLWKDNAYWGIFDGLFKKGQFTKRGLIEDTLKFYDSKEQLMSVSKIDDIPADVISLTRELRKKIGDWPAAIIYTPAEVSEALFFNQQKHINVKLGHVEERVYDKYICPFMDVVHLRQPSDFASKRLQPKTVTPYIDKRRKVPQIRVFFDDTLDSISERIKDIEPEEYIFTIDTSSKDNVGEILNPFIEKAIYCVEAARCLGRAPVNVLGATLSEGSDVIECVYQGKFTVTSLARELPCLLESFLLRPVSG